MRSYKSSHRRTRTDMTRGRKPTKEGARRTRLPEALYHEEEATLVRKVAGPSISEFIRNAVLSEARKQLAKHPRKKK